MFRIAFTDEQKQRWKEKVAQIFNAIYNWIMSDGFQI